MRARAVRSTSSTPIAPFSRKYSTMRGWTSRNGGMSTKGLSSAAGSCQRPPRPGPAGQRSQRPARRHQHGEDPGLLERARAEQPEREGDRDGRNRVRARETEARLFPAAAAEDEEGGADEPVRHEANDGGDGRVPGEASVDRAAQRHRGVEPDRDVRRAEPWMDAAED